MVMVIKLVCVAGAGLGGNAEQVKGVMVLQSQSLQKWGIGVSISTFNTHFIPNFVNFGGFTNFSSSM